MAETSKILPAGQERYVTTLVRTGISHELAYTLAEDVSAMAEASIDGKFAVQNRLIEGLINEQTAKIDGQTAKIDGQTAKIEAQTAVIKSQNVAIEAVMRLILENGKEIKASEARQTAAMESLEKRQTDALKSLEKRHAGAMKSLEARFDAHHGRLVGHLIKLLWTIVGAALLGALAAFGDLVKDSLGF